MPARILNVEDMEEPFDVGRSDTERAFLRRLCDRSGGRVVFDTWTFYEQLVVTLCVMDTSVLRTLRVDFDGSGLTAGNDPGHQITSAHLSPDDPDYLRVVGPLPPVVLADQAYEWFQREALRPIERREWDGDEHVWLEWVLADVDRPPSAKYLGRPDRAPDRAVLLEPPW